MGSNDSIEPKEYERLLQVQRNKELKRIKVEETEQKPQKKLSEFC